MPGKAFMSAAGTTAAPSGFITCGITAPSMFWPPADPHRQKGVGLVTPTLLAWSESVVIYDIKSENWVKTAGYRHMQGPLSFKFSPVEQHTSRFNPLAEIRLGNPRDVSDAQNVT
jgi:type IV secretory pathway TraG/TraD family ATPase VirD4